METTRTVWCGPSASSAQSAAKNVIAKDIADFCWVVAIGDGRSPILEALLPNTWQASHVAKQLLRSGTAAAANYGNPNGTEEMSFLWAAPVAIATTAEGWQSYCPGSSQRSRN